MKYIDEFRDRGTVKRLAGRIRADSNGREYRFMEVCGTHTTAIFRFGLRSVLSPNIKLISGPGCPVCVTPADYIDRAVAVSRTPGVITATFGDMLRVPGSRSSLEKERAAGGNIVTVYSTDDALGLAGKNPGSEVVFLGVGFETTVPTVAASILKARKLRMRNYSVLSAHKTMPEAIRALLEGGDTDIDGFLLPGHVSAITGVEAYEFIPKRYGKPCAVAGFEPVDIMQAVLMLIGQKAPKVEIQYSRIVGKSGNRLARDITYRVFKPSSSVWRGLGIIEKSGLKIRKEFSDFDASLKFPAKVSGSVENRSCICGSVLKGLKIPTECKLFGKSCNPAEPVGACMVSSEGVCAAYYKYGRTG